ncbi:MAG: T9SS type A sorting domain-containing protein [Bacteroidia bacterium]|jgi:endonuclease/exonuclease/phosphatase family metal-dependent hydrolase|nr:T9SS type A sorting domain-containing protein [Bacteroidia bacterium]
MRVIIFCLFISFVNQVKAQIPVVGKDTLLEMATWNVEWFGDRDNGPSNETTQYNNVRDILQQSKIDIWGLQEVSEPQTWNTLVATLSTKYFSYISNFNQTQKTAFLYDRNAFSIIQSLSGNVLTDASSSSSFAGRPPLRVTLQTRNRTVVDTVYFFVLHMKAFSDMDSYNQRVSAASILKQELDANYSGKRWVVLGDWNDDLYTSTYNNAPSPYVIFNDTTKYVVISRELTDKGKGSYAFGSPRMIDHIMISAKMKDWYLNKTARVLDELPTVLTNYQNNTSDHYPVIGLFDNRIKQINPPLGISDMEPTMFTIYPNPTAGDIFIQGNQQIKHVMITDVSGKQVFEQAWNKQEGILSLQERLTQGVYVITLQTVNGNYHRRIVIH